MEVKRILIAILLLGLVSCGDVADSQTTNTNIKKKEDTTEVVSINNKKEVPVISKKKDKYVISKKSGITTVSKKIDGKTVNIVSAPSKGFRWINENKVNLDDLQLTVLFSFNSEGRSYTVVGISDGGDYNAHILNGNEVLNDYLNNYSIDDFPNLKNELFQVEEAFRFKIKDNKLYASGYFGWVSYETTKIYSLDNYKEEKQEFYPININTKTTQNVKLYKTEKLEDVLIELPENTKVKVLSQKYSEDKYGRSRRIYKVKLINNKIGYCEPLLGNMIGNFENMYGTGF